MTPIVINILDLIDMGGSDVIGHKLATFFYRNFRI